jgi:predicted O-linked N-acetylglucosamine transferase (SPINDLY family)
VQAAWINFFQTTGLPQMDYVFHAASDDPPDFAGLFTEELWPLGPVFTPFRPATGRLPPAPTPARATNQITFGSFNHPAKLSPAAMATWADLLRSKPDSRLLLKYRYFDDPVLQRAVQTQFAARGVARERLVFAGHSSGEAYFKAFQEVDLMLDSWPAPGSTTTLEALSNGVPVLAMVGEEPNVGGFYARTLLEAVGLADLVTTSPEAFVARALELTEDVDRLDSLRGRVRPGFEASAICDEAGFTRGLERAYGEMFERWRNRVPAKRDAVPADGAA